MNILVIGGAGYIGSHTCKTLAAMGHQLVVYDNLSTGFRELIKWGDFIHGDILDVPRLRNCLRAHKIEGIVHFAAKAYVGESVARPGWYYQNNIVGTLNILEAMRLEGVRHIVVSSSCAVYGTPKCFPITEDCPPQPINPYGASKLFMERMLADFEQAYGISWVSLRYFNAAGADAEGHSGESHDPETHLIPLALLAVKGDAPPLRIFGDDYPTPDGTCIRDYVHVSDLADAHALALQYLQQGNTSATLNLGTGVELSILQLLKTIEDVLGKSVPHTFAERRLGDPPRLVASSALAYKTLHWQPRHSAPQNIIATAWQWLIRASLTDNTCKCRCS